MLVLMQMICGTLLKTVTDSIDGVLRCKRSPIALRKVVFYDLIGYLLQRLAMWFGPSQGTKGCKVL